MLPVVLVSGFLGSGKTTLLLSLLRQGHEQGLKLAVVVNEFGAVDVDSPTLRAAEIEVLAAVAGGCACCSGQDEFVEALQELAARSAADRPDAVIVEASGLADPLLLLDIVTGPALQNELVPAFLICVADASNWNSAASVWGPLLRHQIELADLVCLNKADLVSPEAMGALEVRLAQLNPQAHRASAVSGSMDFGCLWEALRSPNVVPSRSASPPQRPASESEPPTHATAHAVVCPLPHPVPLPRLEEVLQRMPLGVWRAKGFLRVQGTAGLQMLQFTGGEVPRWRLGPVYLALGQDEPELAVVLLGSRLNETALLQEWAKLAHSAAW